MLTSPPPGLLIPTFMFAGSHSVSVFLSLGGDPILTITGAGAGRAFRHGFSEHGELQRELGGRLGRKVRHHDMSEIVGRSGVDDIAHRAGRDRHRGGIGDRLHRNAGMGADGLVAIVHGEVDLRRDIRDVLAGRVGPGAVMIVDQRAAGRARRIERDIGHLQRIVIDVGDLASLQQIVRAEGDRAILLHVADAVQAWTDLRHVVGAGHITDTTWVTETPAVSVARTVKVS